MVAWVVEEVILSIYFFVFANRNVGHKLGHVYYIILFPKENEEELRFFNLGSGLLNKGMNLPLKIVYFLETSHSFPFDGWYLVEANPIVVLGKNLYGKRFIGVPKFVKGLKSYEQIFPSKFIDEN